MRFIFSPPADHAAGLLTLPWSEPLADWRDERLVEIRQRGISRHVVRFVYNDDTLYALKELSERLARREYRLLRALAELGVPAVEVVGVAVDRERVYGELLDLQAGELLPADVEPTEIAEELGRRYESLWRELTREEILRPEEQRYRIAERLRRLNELGFDADEVELVSTGDGNKLRLKTRVAETGHDSRKLFLRTGIDAGERQARRLLNDMAAFRAWAEQKQGRPVSEVVAANRWLEEVYDPVIAAIPEELRGRLSPAEVFSEVLEHRWYMSEAAGRDVGTTAATRDYIDHVLPAAPDPLSTGEPTGPIEILGSLGDG